jgi:hypothetical protein
MFNNSLPAVEDNSNSISRNDDLVEILSQIPHSPETRYRRYVIGMTLPNSSSESTFPFRPVAYDFPDIFGSVGNLGNMNRNQNMSSSLVWGMTNTYHMDEFDNLCDLSDLPDLDDVSDSEDLPELQDLSDSEDLPELQDLSDSEDLPELQDVVMILREEELMKLKQLDYGDANAVEKLTDDDTCVICYIEYSETKDMSCCELLCGHYFHYDCIYKWLSEYNNKCPLCKGSVGKYEPKIEN